MSSIQFWLKMSFISIHFGFSNIYNFPNCYSELSDELKREREREKENKVKIN